VEYFYRLVWVECKLCTGNSILRWTCEHRSRCWHRRKGEMGRLSCHLQRRGCDIHRRRILGRWLLDSWEWRALWRRFM